ncbi:winged helix-turn-helix domain-containing protein [uncultured Selenomonas sp.]|uniref:winged helix-turn-helix domain-containing protein n=1 Tax=uncultured Selenomonas sp. TaxID=159275 RepID=UPI003425BCC3
MSRKNDSDDSKRKVSDSDHTSLDARILDTLKDHPDISQIELARALNVASSTIARHTISLQQMGKLIRKGNRRSGKWVVVGKHS